MQGWQETAGLGGNLHGCGPAASNSGPCTSDLGDTSITHNAQFTSQTLASIDAPALLVDVHHVLQAVRAAVQRACLAAVVERRALQAAIMHAALVLDIHLSSSCTRLSNKPPGL